MNLENVKWLATRRRKAGLTGIVMQVDEVLELVNRVEQLEKTVEGGVWRPGGEARLAVMARKARMARLALLDHDLALARMFLMQIDRLGTEEVEMED